MHRFVTIFVAVLMLATFASIGNASVLTDRLTFDGPIHHTPVPFQGGGEDKIQDDSITAFLDLDGTPGFSPGDVVWGIINITNTVSSSLFNSVGTGQLEQITIVYSAKIVGAGSGGSVSLAPIGASGADWDLRNILSGSIQNDLPSGLSDSTVAVIMSNNTGTSEVGGINPLNLNALLGVPGAGSALSVVNNITNANGWFADASIEMAAGDFFEFLGSLALGGTQRGGFSVEEANFAADFLPVDVFNFGAVSSVHDVTLDVATVTIANQGEQDRGWIFRDQSSLFVNVYVPEPTSIGVWILLSCIAGFAGRRPSRA